MTFNIMTNFYATTYDNISRSHVQKFSENLGKANVSIAIHEMDSDDKAILLSKLIAIKYCRSQGNDSAQETYWKYISENIIGKTLTGVDLYELMAFIKNQSSVFQKTLPATFKQLLPSNINEQVTILSKFPDKEYMEIKAFLANATGNEWGGY